MNISGACMQESSINVCAFPILYTLFLYYGKRRLRLELTLQAIKHICLELRERMERP